MTSNNQWRDIPGYKGYQANSIGEIKSVDRTINDKRCGKRSIKGRLLKPQISNCGYLVLYVNGKTKLVHRLVASAFLDDFNEKPEVNHIDGIKTNNKVSNLEMVSRSENANHMYKNGLMKGKLKKEGGNRRHGSIRVIAIDIKSGKIIHKFNSMNDAEKLGFDSGCISRACNGIVSQHKGFIWKSLD